MLIPETEKPATMGDVKIEVERPGVNIIDAASRGAADGLQLALNVGAMLIAFIGLDWDEGPDTGGPFAPYSQSERRSFYVDAWRKLRDGGFIYPCTCTRKDLERALSAPHEALQANRSGPWQKS